MKKGITSALATLIVTSFLLLATTATAKNDRPIFDVHLLSGYLGSSPHTDGENPFDVTSRRGTLSSLKASVEKKCTEMRNGSVKKSQEIDAGANKYVFVLCLQHA